LDRLAPVAVCRCDNRTVTGFVARNSSRLKPALPGRGNGEIGRWGQVIAAGPEAAIG
jgi:hypothetical protein